MAEDTAAEQRILIVGPSWVGDMVMAQSLFMALHKHAVRPPVIDVLAPAWSRPLLERMPQVRHAIDLPLGHGELGLRARYRAGVALREAHYDQAIVLPNSFKSALIPWFARIPRRTGWRGEMRGPVLTDCRILDKQALPLMVQRFVALGLPAGAADAIVLPLSACPRPALQSSAEQVQATLTALAVPPVAGERLVLCPGAEFGDAKQWPASHFAGLATRALAAGWQVLIAGSGKDRAIADEIISLLDPGLRDGSINLCGRTSLSQVIDVLASATAVVSNDSGLMHIAAALQRPLVALYGSTSADFTPPLADRVKLLASSIECRPCFERTCPLGHRRCLTELTPDLAWNSLQELLGRATPANIIATGVN